MKTRYINSSNILLGKKIYFNLIIFHTKLLWVALG